MRHRLLSSIPATPRRGDVVGDRVYDGRRWLPIVAPVDHSLKGEKGDQGEPGADGRDGADGSPGADGLGFTLRGKWSPGSYAPLDVVTHQGSSFVAGVATKAEPPGKGWQLLARRGKHGAAGERKEFYSSVTRRVVEGANHDVDLAFLENAPAGTALYLACDDKCGVTNSLSRYRLVSAIGFSVADTIAGSRGLVRTAGIITVPQCLAAGANYCLSGYGQLAIDPSPAAAAVMMGVAIDEHRLLIRPQVAYVSNDLLTANLTAGSKGQVVALVGADTIALYDGSEFAIGVLTEDVADGVGNYFGIGSVTQANWSAVLESGDATLVNGTSYYASKSAPGKLTTESENHVFVGQAKSTTKLRVSIASPPPYDSIVA